MHSPHLSSKIIAAAQLETPLGMMLALADEGVLYFLDFVDAAVIKSLNQKLSGAARGSHVGVWKGKDERWSSSFFQNELCNFLKLDRKIKKICTTQRAMIMPGMTKIHHSIEQELALYFEGKLQDFKTPYHLIGSPFQQQVWKTLLTIPYGKTISYAGEAHALKKPAAVRAVANANGANQLAIIIPCHRVISSSGGLGGYGSGLGRKEWLLNLEAKNVNRT